MNLKLILIILFVFLVKFSLAQKSRLTTQVYIETNSGATFLKLNTFKNDYSIYNKTYTPSLSASLTGGVEYHLENKKIFFKTAFQASLSSFKKIYGVFNEKLANNGANYFVLFEADSVTVQNYTYELPIAIGFKDGNFKASLALSPLYNFFYHDKHYRRPIFYLNNFLKLNSIIQLSYILPTERKNIAFCLTQTYLVTPYQLDYYFDYVLNIHIANTTIGLTYYFKK